LAKESLLAKAFMGTTQVRHRLDDAFFFCLWDPFLTGCYVGYRHH
jgi:hypothetical protein